MIYEHKGISVYKSCKNKCIEKMIDEAINKNTINDIEPKPNLYNFWYSQIDVKRYSEKLGRHIEKRNGNDFSKRWEYCPFCGEKLIEK